jgi:hypothetical protein
MMPERWERAQQIITSLKLPIQAVTYNGVAHRTLPEMSADVVAFFQANDDGEGLTRSLSQRGSRRSHHTGRRIHVTSEADEPGVFLDSSARRRPPPARIRAKVM